MRVKVDNLIFDTTNVVAFELDAVTQEVNLFMKNGKTLVIRERKAAKRFWDWYNEYIGISKDLSE